MAISFEAKVIMQFRRRNAFCIQGIQTTCVAKYILQKESKHVSYSDDTAAGSKKKIVLISGHRNAVAPLIGPY